ncbi:MAG: hypothetical protein ABW321_05205 [Polyangiales bacterium]
MGSVFVRLVQARSKPVVDTKGSGDASTDDERASRGTLPMGPSPLPAPGGADEPGGAEARPRQDEPATLRVLLIGNSYTMHHSLHQMLQRVAAAVEGGPHVTVDAVARGGYSLRNHLRTGDALTRIRAGHYTHVVLQGHSLSAVDHPTELNADAERFKQAIDAAASRTVLYATWARSPEVSLYRTHKVVHSFADMSTRVSTTYVDISSRIGAGLAPVGSAFERALVEHPRLSLWGSDGSHPSLAGSYMAACVLYGAITGTDPNLTTYVPNGLNHNDAATVRAVAAQALAAARNANPPALIEASTSVERNPL